MERVLAGQPATPDPTGHRPTPAPDPERNLYHSGEPVDPSPIKLRFEPEDLQNTEIG